MRRYFCVHVTWLGQNEPDTKFVEARCVLDALTAVMTVNVTGIGNCVMSSAAKDVKVVEVKHKDWIANVGITTFV